MTDVAQPLKPIKQAIIQHLQTLQANQIIGSFQAFDVTKDPLEETKNAVDWPVVLLGMDQTENEYITNRANLRTYKFQMIVMQKYDKLSDNITGMEELKDKILNEFDNDPTLGGAANMVEAVTTPLPTLSTPDKTYDLFILNINAKIAIDLTFSS